MTGGGSSPARRCSRLPRSPRRWPGARTTCGTRRRLLWLNAGVPPTEVARRLGHSVAVLLKVYANCIDGGEDGVNDRIGGALG